GGHEGIGLNRVTASPYGIARQCRSLSLHATRRGCAITGVERTRIGRLRDLRATREKSEERDDEPGEPRTTSAHAHRSKSHFRPGGEERQWQSQRGLVAIDGNAWPRREPEQANRGDDGCAARQPKLAAGADAGERGSDAARAGNERRVRLTAGVQMVHT